MQRTKAKFIVIEIVLIAFDVFLYLKVKRKISLDIIIIYIYYNIQRYEDCKILYMIKNLL